MFELVCCAVCFCLGVAFADKAKAPLIALKDWVDAKLVEWKLK